MNVIVKKEHILRYFAKNPQYKKVNGLKDMRIDIRILEISPKFRLIPGGKDF